MLTFYFVSGFRKRRWESRRSPGIHRCPDAGDHRCSYCNEQWVAVQRKRHGRYRALRSITSIVESRFCISCGEKRSARCFLHHEKKPLIAAALKTTFHREEPMKSVEGNSADSQISCLSQTVVGPECSMLVGVAQRSGPWPSFRSDTVRRRQLVRPFARRKSVTLQRRRTGTGTMRTKRKRWQYP